MLFPVTSQINVSCNEYSEAKYCGFAGPYPGIRLVCACCVFAVRIPPLADSAHDNTNPCVRTGITVSICVTRSFSCSLYLSLPLSLSLVLWQQLKRRIKRDDSSSSGSVKGDSKWCWGPKFNQVNTLALLWMGDRWRGSSYFMDQKKPTQVLLGFGERGEG